VSTLLLRLAAPMQSWGSSSRFKQRSTDAAPTKSGVLGLLAAARGIRRTESIEDLLSLRFGVRLDQPGRIERDFQTARSLDGGHAYPLTERYYLADAVFLAAVEGHEELVAGLDEALRNPVFPLFLGRRSCPPVGPLDLGIRQCNLWDALSLEPWQASHWWRVRQAPTVQVELRVDSDCVDETVSGVTRLTQRDVPISFDPELRQWGTRSVTQSFITIHNEDSREYSKSLHDPMAVLGGA